MLSAAGLMTSEDYLHDPLLAFSQADSQEISNAER
jgi:hypothetical protein